MFVLTVSGIDEGGGHGKSVPASKLLSVFFKPSADPFQGTADNKDLIIIAAKGIEGIGIALFFIDGAVSDIEAVEFDSMKLGRIFERLLCPSTVLQKYLVDTEVAVVDTILIDGFPVALQKCLLQSSSMRKKIKPFFLTEVPDNCQGPPLKRIGIHPSSLITLGQKKTGTTAG
jgi:hypothetical protein